MDTTETNNKYYLPAAVILAGLFIGGAVIWNGSHPAGTAGPSGQTPRGTQPSINIANVKMDGDPFIGRADAPVTIAFWSDFQCPFCKQFEVGNPPDPTTPSTFQRIITDYVDTGKVRIVFMDFVFLGNDSNDAAAYSRAVWKLYPEQYFAWRTAMYEAQDEEGNKGFGNAASIDKLSAKIPGIDAGKLAADVKENAAAYAAAAIADRNEGQKVGINATPSFVIGTQVIQGAYPYDTFKTAIDAALK